MSSSRPVGRPLVMPPPLPVPAPQSRFPRWVIAAIAGVVLLFLAGVATVIALAVRASRGPEIAVDVPDDFIEHASPAGIGMRAPAEWLEMPASPPIEVNLATPGSVKVMANLLSQTEEPNTSLHNLADHAGDYLKTRFQHLSTVSGRVVRLNGEQAAELVYDCDGANSARVRVEQYIWLSGGKQYVLSMGVPPNLFNQYQPIFLQMASSVRFSGATESPASRRGSGSVVVGASPTPTPTPTRTTTPPPVRASTTSPALPPRTGRPFGTTVPSRTVAAPSAGPTVAETAARLQQIQAKWLDPAKVGTPVLSTMSGSGARPAGATDVPTTLQRGQRITTRDRYTPPVTFRVALLSNNNDIRFGYGFSQMIFNWEMQPSELRVDGGPINGKHLPGAGALPAGQWTGIELIVTPTECVMRVDGVERYRMAGDFSAVNQPFSILSHMGQTQVMSVDVVR